MHTDKQILECASRAAPGRCQCHHAAMCLERMRCEALRDGTAMTSDVHVKLFDRWYAGRIVRRVFGYAGLAKAHHVFIEITDTRGYTGTVVLMVG